MERESAELNPQKSNEVGVLRFIVGFIVFLYKTAIRP